MKIVFQYLTIPCLVVLIMCIIANGFVPNGPYSGTISTVGLIALVLGFVFLLLATPPGWLRIHRSDDNSAPLRIHPPESETEDEGKK